MASQTALADAESGGTPAEQSQNQASLISAQQQLTVDQNQLTSDQTALQDCSGGVHGEPGARLSGIGQRLREQLVQLRVRRYPELRIERKLGHRQRQSCPTPQPVTAPVATTGSASGVGTTSANLGGTVVPSGAATTYYFEYGTSTALGSVTPSSTTGTGSTPVSVSVTVTGLTPDTSYLFELVATNSAGSSTGVPVVVTTAQSSCVTDQQTVTAAEQAVAHDQATVAAQQLTVSAAQANLVVTPSTVAEDQAAVAQDQVTVKTDTTAVGQYQAGRHHQRHRHLGDRIGGSDGQWVGVHDQLGQPGQLR